MGNQSSCCSCVSNTDKNTEISAAAIRTPNAPVAFVQMYQHTHEDSYFARVRASLYKIMIADEPFPMVIEISHNENWDVTKVVIDHRDMVTV